MSYWKYVEKTNSCWNWKGAKCFGYGVYVYEGKRWRAHRLSYLFAFGDFNKKMFVCHKCDNPACVNPDHLFLGTANDNIQDMIKKGRWSPKVCKRGEQNHQHKLHDKDIPVIRELCKKGKTQREVAKRFSVSQNTINNIIQGKVWKHIMKSSKK